MVEVSKGYMQGKIRQHFSIKPIWSRIQVKMYLTSGERRLQGRGVNGALFLLRQRSRRIPPGGGSRHPRRVQGIPHGHLDDWQPGMRVRPDLLYLLF